MKRLVVAVVVVSCLMRAWAMPTRAELTKAQPLVVELMAPAMETYKTAGAQEKTAAAVKVGDTSSEFAKAAETEAARFLLLKGAVNFYTRGEAYDKAADAVAALQTTVKDVTPAVIAEITGKATSKISETKAPRLFALYRSAKLQVRAVSEAKTLAQKLKKVKSDALQRRYAEALAVSGDWKKAYGEFAKLSDAKLKAVVEAEAKGKAKNAESGEFWWGYEPEMEDAADFFKTHAAAFYRQALAAGEITGLKKNIVEQRIKDYGESGEVARGGQGTSPHTPAASGLYCVIDLSGGPDAKKYPVSYLNDMPKGGWSDEYKTTKLVLRRIEPGKPVLVGRGSEQRRTSVSEPYYLGVFEVTQGQWEQVMGTRPSFWRGKDYKKRPVECVSYDLIRGKINGGAWPRSNEVDPGSFMGCAREKSGKAFDLPTDKQWEYACAAGCEADYNNGGMCANGMKNAAMDAVGRYKFNGGWNEEKWGKFSWDVLWKSVDRECDTRSGTAAVGSYEPNKWGFYDMHGNVWEWCLDMDSEHDGERILRCSWWLDFADQCRTSVRKHGKPNVGSVMHGFRLCLPLAGGAAALTPAAAPAPAAKVGKAWQEKGNEATLDLGEKYGKLEFVKCPAGRVDMVVSSGGETCKVNISRPFWIMKKPITLKQGRYRQGPIDKDEYPFWRREQIESVIDRISTDFRSDFPMGYVMRLPTLAEWEYAFHANTHDRKNPYYDLTKNHRDDEFGKKIYDVPGCINPKVANDWGLTDYSWEKVLDKFTVGELKAFNGGFDPVNKPGNVSVIPKPSEKTDPLYWTEDEPNQIYISRMPDWVLWRCRMPAGTKDAGNDNTHTRLVIGPDLVSEWKAKHGKK